MAGNQASCFDCVDYEMLAILTKLFLSFALEVNISKDNTCNVISLVWFI